MLLRATSIPQRPIQNAIRRYHLDQLTFHTIKFIFKNVQQCRFIIVFFGVQTQWVTGDEVTNPAIDYGKIRDNLRHDEHKNIEGNSTHYNEYRNDLLATWGKIMGRAYLTTHSKKSNKA